MANLIKEFITKGRKAFNSGRTRPLEFRENQLRNFLRLYDENLPQILKALKIDLNKSKQEALIAEILINISGIKNTLVNLKQWTSPEKPSKSVLNSLDELLVYNDPYGVVLVIGAWNYPILVCLGPMAAAISAGNCVILKPSELSSESAKVMAELIPKYLDNDCYQVFLGGPEETKQILKHKFDYIFFTGSPKIGKLVHEAANKYLTPTALELGGKNPCILDESADLDIAVRRILWGKCLNAGQTCVAPDYLLCNRGVGKKFINIAKFTINEFYGEDPQKSQDLGRIINENHFNRLCKLIENGKIVIGGKYDQQDRYIEPTIVDDVKRTDLIMQEEIFGPILPILYVDSIEEAITYINDNEKPLALYLFTKKKRILNLVLNNTYSGGVTVNDTVLHAGAQNLPFGGVGNSGMGNYHGKYGFDTFVHKKAILITTLSSIGEKFNSVRYPPYSESKIKFVLKAFDAQFPFSLKFLPYVMVFTLGLISAFGLKFAKTYFESEI